MNNHLPVFMVQNVKDFMRFMDDRIEEYGDPEVLFQYEHTDYMFHDYGDTCRCLDTCSGAPEGFIQEFDCWENLYLNAKMLDGRLFQDVLREGKVFFV